VNILADVEEAEQAVSREHGRLHGRLRVALPLSFGLLQLGPAITAFLRAHPEVEFELDFNDRQVDLLAEGFDLALRIGDLADSTLIARRLATIQSCVCASPAYLERAGIPAHPDELARHACLTYSLVPEPQVWRYTTPDGKLGSVRVSSRLQANNGDFLHRAALEGQGIVLQPLFIVQRSLAEGRLSSLLTEYEWPATSAHALYPHTRHLSHRVRAFIDFLSDWFSKPGSESNFF
jgi:DNA-binding transcriptional LysR family regulator